MQPTPRWRLILNGKSAGDQAVREAVTALREQGVRLDVRVTWEGGDAERYVAEAIADGVDTVIHMAVDYGLALGFPAESLIVALLLTQFVGFPAAIVFGRLGERWGPRSGILIAIAVYFGVTVWGYFIRQPWEFYAMAVAIGLVQGGVQSLSRSLYARLIPAEKSGEFFGFFNMLGKFAAVLGPVLMGGVSLLTGNPRLSILSLLVLFVGGALLLLKKAKKQHKMAFAPFIFAGMYLVCAFAG